ncbi:MAG: methyl-accepting chemotaxis protein [Spirochaetota bacterium]|nr:methyl-accepting chemotaxis protein [Spirochaetota bacterium]
MKGKSFILVIAAALVLFASIFIQELNGRIVVAGPAFLVLFVSAILMLRAKGPGPAGRVPPEEVGVTEREPPGLESAPGAEIDAREEKETVDPEVLHAANETAGEALRGMTEVLPILAQQLQSVIDYTEQAAMDLSNSFISINRKAKNQVRDVQHIFGGISGEEADREESSVLHDIRNNLDSLTVGLDQLLILIKKNTESTSRILRQTQSIEKIVEASSEITENSRVLSINATIEAARAGQHGRGFAVVAREFQQMTQRSEESTREIQEVVNKISELSETVHRETRESEEISLRLGREAKTHGQKSVDKINTMIAQTRYDLEKLSAQAEEFARDISSIVMSIQFQDITRQRIEHVIEPLNEFTSDLERIASYLESIDAFDTLQHISQSRSAIDRLKEKYTMESEREIMEQNVMEKTQRKGEEHVTASSDN